MQDGKERHDRYTDNGCRLLGGCVALGDDLRQQPLCDKGTYGDGQANQKVLQSGGFV